MYKVIGDYVYETQDRGDIKETILLGRTKRYHGVVIGSIVVLSLKDYQDQELPFESVQVEVSGADVETNIFVCNDGIIDFQGYRSLKLVVRTLSNHADNVEVVFEL